MKDYDGTPLKVLWSDRKRYFGLPISFTTYKLVEKPGFWVKLFVGTGILSKHEEETHVYKIDDISVHQTLGQRIFGCGTIRLWCQDASDSYMSLVSVKNPYRLRDLFSEIIETERSKKRFGFLEHSHG